MLTVCCYDSFKRGVDNACPSAFVSLQSHRYVVPALRYPPILGAVLLHNPGNTGRPSPLTPGKGGMNVIPVTRHDEGEACIGCLSPAMGNRQNPKSAARQNSASNNSSSNMLPSGSIIVRWAAKSSPWISFKATHWQRLYPGFTACCWKTPSGLPVCQLNIKNNMIIFYYHYFVEQAGYSTPASMVRQRGSRRYKKHIASRVLPTHRSKRLDLILTTTLLKLNIFRVKCKLSFSFRWTLSSIFGNQTI